MAYVALARKYRPLALDQVIGQDPVVRTLKNAIALQRIHHAYLFTGARGVGKTSIARILAKSLNCVKGPTAEICGECTSCVEITKSSSPDVLEIDGASNTSVDDVRSLRETVQYLPAKGRYKVYIIDEVHMLSTSAFNALLKTLEEPPAHVIFVFATTEPHKIPVTILSRCQRFDFRRVSLQVLKARLEHVVRSEQLTFSDVALSLVAKAADGSVRDAMSLLDQVIAFAGNQVEEAQVREALGLLDREKVRALLAALLSRDQAAISALVHDAYEAGVDLAEIGERLVEALRDLTLFKLANGQGATFSGLTGDELKSLGELALQHSDSDLHRLFNLLLKTVEETGVSPFAHLVFEMGLLRACTLEPVTPLSSIVAELRGQAPPSTGGSGGQSSNHKPAAQQPVEATPKHLSTAATSAPAPTPSITATTMVTPSASPGPSVGQRQLPKPRDYRDFTEQVRALKPRLGAALENLSCGSFSDQAVQLLIPSGQEVFGEMLLDAEGMAQLRELASKLFGHAVSITIEHGGQTTQAAAPATIAEERRQERRDEVSALKRGASEHPAIVTVLEKLGGEIRGVSVRAALAHAPEDYE